MTMPGKTAKRTLIGSSRKTIGFKMRSNTASDSRRATRVKILRCTNPQREKKEGKTVRHPSTHVEDLDAMMRTQVLHAFAFGPAKLFHVDGDADVLELEKELSTYRQHRQNVLDLMDEGVITKAEAATRIRKWEEPIRNVEEGLRTAASASATAHMLVDLRDQFIDTQSHRASFEGLGALLTELGERFDALPIQKRRDLANTLLEVTVHRGKGKEKYVLRHKVVTTLNDGDEFALED